jgi:hypothetical protein
MGILLFVVILVVSLLITGAICYQKFAVPAYRLLTPDDRRLCIMIVKEGKGFPLLCPYCIRKGACPCQPCQMVSELRNNHASMS